LFHSNYSEKLIDIIKEQNAERTKGNLLPVTEMQGIKSKDNFRQLMSQARKNQREFLAAQQDEGGIKLSEQQIQDMVDTAQPFLVYAGESMGYFLAEGLIQQDFLTQAAQEQAKKIGGIFGSIPYSFSEYSAEQLMGAANSPEYYAINKSIEKLGGGAEDTRAEGEILFPEDSLNPIYMKKDWKIVQYLLGRILDVGEKQLEGIYNLPGNSSFYVPFDAYKMGAGGGGSGGGGGGGYTEPEKGTKNPIPYDATGEMLKNVVYPTYKEFPFSNEAMERFKKEPKTSSTTARTAYDKAGASKDFQLTLDQRLLKDSTNVEKLQLNALEQIKLILQGISNFGSSNQPQEDKSLDKSKNPTLPIATEESFTNYSKILENTLFDIKTLMPGPPIPESLNLNPQGNLKDTGRMAEITLNPDIKINPQPIKVNFNTTTMLTVDGRMLATVIMPYLYQSMISNEAVGGGAVRRDVM